MLGIRVYRTDDIGMSSGFYPWRLRESWDGGYIFVLGVSPTGCKWMHYCTQHHDPEFSK